MDLVATDQSYTAILAEKQLDDLTMVVTSDYRQTFRHFPRITRILFAHLAYGFSSPGGK